MRAQKPSDGKWKASANKQAMVGIEAEAEGMDHGNRKASSFQDHRGKWKACEQKRETGNH